MKRRQFFSMLGVAASAPAMVAAAENLAGPEKIAAGAVTSVDVSQRKVIEDPPYWAEYLRDKRSVPGLLGYDMGGFVDFFQEDAEIVSEVCDVYLSRGRWLASGEEYRLAGLPRPYSIYANGKPCGFEVPGGKFGFFNLLLRAGHSVQIAVYQPGFKDGLIRRKVRIAGFPGLGWVVK